MNFPPPSAHQARLIWAALTGLAIATIISLIAGLIWGLGEVLRILGPVLWPLAVAGVVAYLLDPVVDWLERRKLPRTRAIICLLFAAPCEPIPLCFVRAPVSHRSPQTDA